MYKLRSLLVAFICLFVSAQTTVSADDFLDQVRKLVKDGTMKFGMGKETFGDAVEGLSLNHIHNDILNLNDSDELLKMKAANLYARYSETQYDIDAASYVSEIMRGKVSADEIKTVVTELASPKAKSAYNHGLGLSKDSIVSGLIDLILPAYYSIKTGNTPDPLRVPNSCTVKFEKAFRSYIQNSHIDKVLDVFMASLSDNNPNEKALKSYIKTNMPVLLVTYFNGKLTTEDAQYLDSIYQKPEFQKIANAYSNAVSNVDAFSRGMTTRYVNWLKKQPYN